MVSISVVVTENEWRETTVTSPGVSGNSWWKRPYFLRVGRRCTTGGDVPYGDYMLLLLYVWHDILHAHDGPELPFSSRRRTHFVFLLSGPAARMTSVCQWLLQYRVGVCALVASSQPVRTISSTPYWAAPGSINYYYRLPRPPADVRVHYPSVVHRSHMVSDLFRR
jgi:hypothetical protein